MAGTRADERGGDGRGPAVDGGEGAGRCSPCRCYQRSADDGRPWAAWPQASQPSNSSSSSSRSIAPRCRCRPQQLRGRRVSPRTARAARDRRTASAGAPRPVRPAGLEEVHGGPRQATEPDLARDGLHGASRRSSRAPSGSSPEPRAGRDRVALGDAACRTARVGRAGPAGAVARSGATARARRSTGRARTPRMPRLRGGRRSRARSRMSCSSSRTGRPPPGRPRRAGSRRRRSPGPGNATLARPSSRTRAIALRAARSIAARSSGDRARGTRHGRRPWRRAVRPGDDGVPRETVPGGSRRTRCVATGALELARHAVDIHRDVAAGAHDRVDLEVDVPLFHSSCVRHLAPRRREVPDLDSATWWHLHPWDRNGASPVTTPHRPPSPRQTQRR